MPTLRTVVSRLFTLPGGLPSGRGLLVQAAHAHRHLFERECGNTPALGASLPCLTSRLRLCDRRHPFEEVCCHPTFVEGLHRLAPACPRLKAWREAVASPSALDVAPHTGSDFGPLGAVELALRLRDGCQWQQALRINTDMYGRMSFPFSDWQIALHTANAACDCVLANEAVVVAADRDLLRWQWAGDEAPFLTVPRNDCRALFDGDLIESARGRCESLQVAPDFTYSCPLCQAGARYDRIHIADASHAEQTADIIRFLHFAMRRNSPDMHHEFCEYMSAIRGFELQLTTLGTVQSFSDPALPGVMSVNIPYTDRHEPRLSPLSFTWLAHELAHTKFYLINDVAYDHGWVFVKNGAELTDELPRYSRQLPIRTLFQIPYTHLYEWESLMDFLDADFSGLPWPVDENPIVYGDEVRSEIEEALSLTADIADLTPLGAAAFSHFSDLYSQSLNRWMGLAAA